MESKATQQKASTNSSSNQSESKKQAKKDARAADTEFFENDEEIESSKVDLDGKLKKQSSYTYWVQNNRD